MKAEGTICIFAKNKRIKEMNKREDVNSLFQPTFGNRPEKFIASLIFYIFTSTKPIPKSRFQLSIKI